MYADPSLAASPPGFATAAAALPVIGLVSHALAGLAFLVLMLLLVTSWGRVRAGSLNGALLVAACALTALWGLAAAAAFAVAPAGGGAWRLVAALEVARGVAWVAFLFRLVVVGGGLPRWLPWAVAAVALGTLALDQAATAPEAGRSLRGIPFGGRLLLALTGLLLVENLYRNSREEQRWALKYLCLGAGGLFAYDVFLYADALMFGRVTGTLFEARGATNALLVPLLAVAVARNPDWSCDIFVSRQAVFHTVTLTGGSVYLLAMAGVGYYLRELGGGYGPTLQATFLCAVLLLLLVVLFSGRFRSELYQLLNRHFYSRRYDYHAEWLRFIDTIADPAAATADPARGGLPERVIRAVADVTDSTGGAIWLYRPPDRFRLLAARTLPGPPDLGSPAVEREAPELARDLDGRRRLIPLDPADAEGTDDLPPRPGWLPGPPVGWLLLPLIHRDRLLGCLLLGRPRAPRRLNWEDRELLRILARQAASYVAEDEAARALAEARQYEAFNRRFAFVVHDLKSVVGQLALTLANAGRHRHNPEFVDDMIATIEAAVAQMNRLRAEMGRAAAAPAEPVRLAGLLARVEARFAGTIATVAAGCGGGGRLRVRHPLPDVVAAVDPERLASVVGHLVDNGLEAAGPTGRVTLGLRAEGRRAVIEIEDDGPGMDPRFLRERLFRPFASTKAGGLGIGVAEARQFAEEAGGRLDADSRPGRGTAMRLYLPLLAGGEAPPARAAG